MGQIKAGQRLKILEVVKDSGWDLAVVRWSARGEDCLEYRPSRSNAGVADYYLDFEWNDTFGRFELKMVPGKHVQVEEYQSTLDRLPYFVKEWLKYLAVELHDEQRLKGLDTAVKLVAGALPFGVAAIPVPFSSDEAAALRTKLDEVMVKVDALDQMQQEDRQAMRETVEELRDAIGKLTKKGWVDMVRGAVINSLAGSVINKDNLRGLIDWVNGP